MAVERLTDYTRRIWTALDADAPEGHDFEVGDVIYYMDSSQCGIVTYVYPEGSIDVEFLPDIGGGGGDDIYYSEYNGALYQKEVDINMINSTTRIGFRNCPYLEKYTYTNTDKGARGAGQNFMAFNSALKEVYYKAKLSMTSNNREFADDKALETVVLGDIGYPIATMSAGNIFQGCTQQGLTITVYVQDDASLPFGAAPWGATNATIIYRSATTGEVLSV